MSSLQPKDMQIRIGQRNVCIYYSVHKQQSFGSLKAGTMYKTPEWKKKKKRVTNKCCRDFTVFTLTCYSSVYEGIRTKSKESIIHSKYKDFEARQVFLFQ